MGKLNFAIATVLAFALFACSPNKKREKESKTEETEKEIGKYVYMDTNKTLHIDRDCMSFILNEKASFGVHPIKRSELKLNDIYFICTECVSDQNYENLKKECFENKGYDTSKRGWLLPKDDQPNKNLIWVYENLKKDGFTDIGKDISEFSDIMKNANNQKKLFDYIKTKNVRNMPKSLAEFSELIGIYPDSI